MTEFKGFGGTFIFMDSVRLEWTWIAIKVLFTFLFFGWWTIALKWWKCLTIYCQVINVTERVQITYALYIRYGVCCALRVWWGDACAASQGSWWRIIYINWINFLRCNWILVEYSPVISASWSSWSLWLGLLLLYRLLWQLWIDEVEFSQQLVLIQIVLRFWHGLLRLMHTLSMRSRTWVLMSVLELLQRLKHQVALVFALLLHVVVNVDEGLESLLARVAVFGIDIVWVLFDGPPPFLALALALLWSCLDFFVETRNARATAEVWGWTDGWAWWWEAAAWALFIALVALPLVFLDGAEPQLF